MVEETEAAEGRRLLALAVTGASAAGASRVLERALDREPERGSGLTQPLPDCGAVGKAPSLPQPLPAPRD